MHPQTLVAVLYKFFTVFLPVFFLQFCIVFCEALERVRDWGAGDSGCLLLNLLPHPEAVNPCASGWPASAVGRTLDSWFR